jgi:hypothetical protein
MCPKVAGIGQSRPKMNIFGRVAGGFLTSCFGLMTDSALYQMDVPALSYIYAAYGKSGLISNGKE